MAQSKANELNLKISQSKHDDGKIQLNITIPAARIDDLIKNAAFSLAMQNQIDMKTVKIEDLESTVMDKVGEAQYNAFITQYAMSALTPYAISDKGITPIMEPQLNSSGNVTLGKDFSFSAVVTQKPSYELSSYDTVTVKIPPVTVTDEEIEQQIYNLAERSATTVEDKGAEVAPGREVAFGIKSSFKDDGEELSFLTADRRVYVLGADYLPKEFDEGIIGMKGGESKTIEFELPGAPNADGSPGSTRTVVSTVDMIQVNKRVVPSITSAWVEVNVPEAKTLDGLREMMRKEGREFKEKERDNMKFFLVASALAERFQGHIDDEVYEYTRGDMLANLNEQLRQNNMTLEQYIQSVGMEEQQFNMTFMMQVRETLRQSFALDALARHLKLTLTEEDIADTLTRMAPGNEDRARADIENSGRSYMLTEAALRTKANKWLYDTATFEVEGEEFGTPAETATPTAPAETAAPTTSAAAEKTAAPEAPAAAEETAAPTTPEAPAASEKPNEG